jgi:hypothetical protein
MNSLNCWNKVKAQKKYCIVLRTKIGQQVRRGKKLEISKKLLNTMGTFTIKNLWRTA